MNSYKLELFLHVATVIVALGVTFVYPFMQGFAERSGVAATRFMLKFSLYLEKFVVIPGAVLLFIFGGLLIGNSNTPNQYKDNMPAWLTIAIVWFLAALAVAVFVQRRNTKRALASLEGVADDAPLPDAYKSTAMQMQIVGGLLGLSVIAIAFLMVWKPGQ